MSDLYLRRADLGSSGQEVFLSLLQAGRLFEKVTQRSSKLMTTDVGKVIVYDTHFVKIRADRDQVESPDRVKLLVTPET